MAGSSYTKDDDFDWEAAIAEIDIACNEAAMSVAPAVTNRGSFSIDIHNDVKNGVLSGFLQTSQTKNSQSGKVPTKVTKALRQATLDAFVDIQEKFKDQDVGNQHPRSYKDSTCEESNADVLKDNVETMSLKNTTREAINADARCYSVDPVAAASWTYPVNVPLRDYQFSIVKTTLFSNTLVALPTGLGKTLIAAVVMYNYFRWFPSGKIVFTAPSRPLVMQQIEACHNIVGIPQKWTIDMTGQISPSQRLVYWQSKRVFFVTPQVLEKDIQSGSCILKELVCLVVDEAHRAVGNYSYCIVVREIMAASIELRILALTATPGSKQESIQKVIDNLHISTLEHRSENDPDVLPYTHNRNIELIPVAMNKETLNLGSLLLEVVQPVIQKLCSLGVFYNKDLPKLTPFEILSARDRFRQSPPAFLSELQYGEVEGYFGLALTLYHIYKLLFSHGIRPSLQMLHQKLQQGSFSRFMGKNEKLWQAKLLMQQNVRHGAPDPKLSKMKEIITEHFNAKDPASTRVIIFTNFRESVKDILESLQNVDAVKAVEFIGQSSGKASKGQSQKVQQEVLQKFRSGGYNTIVATSIGEEGLDIMEVDLVICFDANVSPLRMIQRFGRTGRKRDGRVVILASEGSELQGYMKKKAKENALRKHMRNGGINSFTFHVSARMVPHCYRPKVQFVEMSVDKFMPRGRKSKCGSRQAGSGYDELTESEKCLLKKYFAFCSETLWKPSLIAFPHYQLFPSCIFNIKHSSRTTEMLIHTLESLHEHETRYEIPKPEVESIVGNCSTSRDYVPQGIQEDESECETISSASELDMCDQCTPIKEDKNVLLPSEVTSPSGLIEELQPDAANLAAHDKEQIKNNSSLVNTSLHRCLFNTGFVSVNQAGHVTISSPPSLPLVKEIVSNYEVVSIPNISEKNFSVPGAQGAMISRFQGTSESASFLHKVDSLCITERSLSPNALSIPLPSSKHSSNHISEEIPKERMIGDLHRSPENVIDSFAEFGLFSSIKDQKMASDGKDGQVQVKRYNVKPVVAQGKEMSESVSSTWKNKIQSLKENSLPCLSHSSANNVGRDEIPDSLLDTSTIRDVESMLRNNTSGVLNDATNHYTLNNGTNEICKDETVPLIKSIGDAQIFNTPKDVFSLPPDLPSTQSAKPVDNQLQNFESPSPSKPSPLQTKGTQSGVKNGFSQDWHLSIEDDEQSLRRPCKFKRLRKCKDDGEKSIEEKCSRGNMHATAFRNQNKFKSLKGRQRKKISALPFIDEEAEVSSDEKGSTDEDDDDERSINSESDSFIDDRLEPTASESSNIDMFAVYRRSLFTQSPSTSGLNQVAYCQAPISDEDDSSHTSENDETYFLSRINPVATPYTSSHVQVVDSKASTSTASHNSDQSGRKVDTSLLESEVIENKHVLRKRELFLQTDDTTVISKCLKSSMSPTVMNELQIENNSSEKGNNHEFLSACIDDDLFIGIDPDALEAEAIEMARLRSNMNQERLNKPFPGESCLVDANAEDSTVANLENSLLDGNPNRSVIEEKVCSNVCLASDYKETRKDISHDLADMDLLCTPSFDLGISDDLN